MKLTYQGNFKVTLLMDELLEEFPEWLIDDPLPDFPDNKKCLLYLESKPDGSEVYLTVPDGSDEIRIEMVIENHDPLKKTDYEKIIGWIRENLQPAVGKDIRVILDLQTVQGKINAAVLFSIGAIDPKNFEIKQLKDWLVPE